MYRMGTAAWALVAMLAVPPQGSDAQQELMRLEQQLGASWKQGDCDAWGAIVAPEWSVVHIDGAVMTRAEAIATCKAPPVRIDTFTIDDVSVRVFDSSAVVTGRTTVRTAGNNPAHVALRFTDVFVRRDGRWRVVSSHATRLVGETAPATPPSLASRLVGTWRLVAFADTDLAGKVSYPFGERPAGYIVYDATGHVFVQIARPPATPESMAAAAAGYFGTYRVDERRGIVIHTVEGSLAPGLAWADQERPIQIDGDTLTIDIRDTTGRYYRELRRVQER